MFLCSFWAAARYLNIGQFDVRTKTNNILSIFCHLSVSTILLIWIFVYTYEYLCTLSATELYGWVSIYNIDHMHFSMYGYRCTVWNKGFVHNVCCYVRLTKDSGTLFLNVVLLTNMTFHWVWRKQQNTNYVCVRQPFWPIVYYMIYNTK